MSPTTISIIVSLVSLGGVIFAAGRVVESLNAVRDALREVRDEQKTHRDSIERVRRDVDLAQRDHDHLVEHVDTHAGHLARLELRLDATPHAGTPAVGRLTRP